MTRTVDWKCMLRERYSIDWLPIPQLEQMVEAAGVLWTTRCAGTKPRAKGRPNELYDSYVTRFFYAFVRRRGLPFAIVSDKYGLHFADESLAYYDIHPSQLQDHERRELGKCIRRKARSRGFDTLVFYNNSPLMSVPYLTMLSYSGLTVYFTTRLPNGDGSNGNYH